MYICDFCETKNKTNLGSCVACGKPLENAKEHVSKSNSKERKPKVGKSSVSSGKSKKLALAAAPVIVLAVGAMIGFTAFSGHKGSSDSLPEPTPSATARAALNDFGLPKNCDEPELTNFAGDLLRQMGANGPVNAGAYGYETSWVDIQNTGGTNVDTADPEKYGALECTYSAPNGSEEDTPKVYLHFDSVAQPRSWMEMEGEEELSLGLGEKLAVYYPGGGGYEWGTGNTWRVWVKDAYLGIDTWSTADSHVEILDKQLFGNVIDLLKGN